MHQQQKHARFSLMVISVAVGLAVLAYAVGYLTVGPEKARAAFGFLGILGLLGLGPYFYRKRKGSQGVIMDERDTDIARRSLILAWAIEWLCWGLACMVPWLVVVLRFGLGRSEEIKVPVIWLPLAYGAMLLVHVSVSSIAVLVQYGKEEGK